MFKPQCLVVSHCETHWHLSRRWDSVFWLKFTDFSHALPFILPLEMPVEYVWNIPWFHHSEKHQNSNPPRFLRGVETCQEYRFLGHVVGQTELGEVVQSCTKVEGRPQATLLSLSAFLKNSWKLRGARVVKDVAQTRWNYRNHMLTALKQDTKHVKVRGEVCTAVLNTLNLLERL